MNIFKKIKKKIRGIGRRTGIMDDFDWPLYYEDEYSKQIYDLEKQYTFVLPDGKFSVADGKIILNPGLLPLNENHKALYESIYELRPDSVLEIGYGCGDHLANIKKILPGVKLNGIDLLQKQLEFLRKRHPELKNQAELIIHDITLGVPKKIKADLAYTQAVLMHIQRHSHYLVALKNIFFVAEKYIVLMEDWTRHNFFEDIERISKEQGFPWKSINFYINDTGKQTALILSKTALNKFKELKNSEELLCQKP